ncbi:glycosyltransferase [Oscillatoria acuminata]|uniref:Glycosyltransferase n=1 Tax=Oscillatoria acuminata PCC 6304 TaxID=56110 RepID=K9TFS6_9CYAN|nr:glycosyltransferase [Oscillatoria acuminata]AFY81395.1 glycosyltransferase [Oscillatoria acuminata PCC 6304]
MYKIIHLSTVHSPFDTRIFHKECKSLAQSGYDVTLVVPHDQDEVLDGVQIKSIRKPKNRLERMTKTVWQVTQVALQINGDLYHFHDPELIGVGLLLKLRRKKVVYDIHEDYQTSIQQKSYLPKYLSYVFSVIFNAVESFLSNFFELVLAEKYYLKRFPKGIVISNYPVIAETKMVVSELKQNTSEIKLLYTGSITEDRGALIHAQIIEKIPNVHLYMVGYCTQQLADKIRKVAGSAIERIHLVGEEKRVPFTTILDFYQQHQWTAGLAIFPETPHYTQKELTKFFEYMDAGIPIICSNFPVWEALIKDNGVGFCVTPDDDQTIFQAIQYLIEHPTERLEMGQRGQKAIREKYNWNVEYYKLQNIYENILGRTIFQ